LGINGTKNRGGMKMNNKIVSLLFVSIFLLVVPASLVQAQAQVPPGQTVGGVQQREREIEKEKELIEKIRKEKEEPEVSEEEIPEGEVSVGKEETVLVSKFKVVGATLLSREEIEEIVKPFEGKELSLKELQGVVDLITRAYREKGYVTSRAYLPPQTIGKDGIVEIRIVEGRRGEIDVQGNRYFSEYIIKKKITIPPGGPFNYNELRQNLIDINEHPDRNVRAVLKPGKEFGTTDVVLEVKDRLPIHASFSYDNFGSRYIGRDRYGVELRHNNLLGRDDTLSLNFQMAKEDMYYFGRARYLFPITNKLDLGFLASHTELDLGKEFKELDAEGKGTVYSLFLNQVLISEYDMDIRLNLAFDYKDIKNYLLDIESSRDDMRVVRLGLDCDFTDRFGRTLLLGEIDIGIPRIMGGLRAVDSRTSRTGAGGEFVKGIFNLYRLQPMPFDSNLLWRNQIQVSSYVLAASEEFQAGGPTNVRGYPPGEITGDSGYATTLEWSFPPYIIPKNWKVPSFSKSGSKLAIYDVVRGVIFYDWAVARLKSPLAGEKRTETLKSAGFGFRLNLVENLSASIDIAYPIHKESSDGDDFQTWIEVVKNF
jgi:hemolysin activation/secretion protein